LAEDFDFIRSEDQELASREIYNELDQLLNWRPSEQELKHLRFTTKFLRASNVCKRICSPEL
jgi:hypothetical protein